MLRVMQRTQGTALLLALGLIGWTGAKANADFLRCSDLPALPGDFGGDGGYTTRTVNYRLDSVLRPSLSLVDCSLKVLPGAYIDLDVGGDHEDSTLSMNGGVITGDISGVWMGMGSGRVEGSFTYGYLSMIGGVIERDVELFHWDDLKLFGGAIGGDVFIRDGADAMLSGGQIDGSVVMSTDFEGFWPQLTVEGYGFQLDGVPVTELQVWGPVDSTFSGYWANGEAFRFDLSMSGPVPIQGTPWDHTPSELLLITVPEPGSSASLAFAAIIVAACCRRANRRHRH